MQISDGNRADIDLAIPTASGLKLAALYQEPNTGKQPYPLVILLHGNTGWKEEEHISTLAADLAKAGIASLRFDAPGSGKSEGTWEHDYRASNYLAAVQDVYSYALRHLPVDSDRVAIWGHSMGGMIAIYAARQHPGQYKAICASQPSAGTMSSKGHGNAVEEWREQGGAHVETEIFGTIWLPAAYFEDRLKFKTAEAVKAVSAPILFIAGTDDTHCNVASVHEIFAAANEPKRYAEYTLDHFYKRDPAKLKEVNHLTVDFLKRNLG